MRTGTLVFLWTISIPIALSAIFGILMPVLWKPIYGADPPDQTIAISTFLAVFIGLLSLVVAVGGGTVFRLLSDRIEAEASVLSDRIGAETSTLLDRITSEADRVTGQAYTQSEKPLVAVWTQLGLMRFEDYDISKNSDLLDEAIDLMERTWVTYVPVLDDRIQEDEELICRVRNNWGFFLATRGNPQDSPIAKSCADYLRPRLADYPQFAQFWSHTIATIEQAYP